MVFGNRKWQRPDRAEREGKGSGIGEATSMKSRRLPRVKVSSEKGSKPFLRPQTTENVARKVMMQMMATCCNLTESDFVRHGTRPSFGHVSSKILATCLPLLGRRAAVVNGDGGVADGTVAAVETANSSEDNVDTHALATTSGVSLNRIVLQARYRASEVCQRGF
jgi:hypothetical protein